MPLPSMTNGVVLAHVLRGAPKALDRLSGPLGEAARAAVALHNARSGAEKRDFVSTLVHEFGNVSRITAVRGAKPTALLLPHDDERTRDEARRLDAALGPSSPPPGRP